ncbi:hypothetical protein [Candidatus Epulonipiscium viviparus]|nr:hypothetical protein [Candidatus Epulopiscium viviparus]
MSKKPQGPKTQKQISKDIANSKIGFKRAMSSGTYGAEDSLKKNI